MSEPHSASGDLRRDTSTHLPHLHPQVRSVRPIGKGEHSVAVCLTNVRKKNSSHPASSELSGQCVLHSCELSPGGISSLGRMELGTNSSAEKSPATMGLLSCLSLALELIEYRSSADPGQMANCGTFRHTNAHVGLQALSARQVSVTESMLVSGLLSLYPSCSLLHPRPRPPLVAMFSLLPCLSALDYFRGPQSSLPLSSSKCKRRSAWL